LGASFSSPSIVVGLKFIDNEGLATGASRPAQVGT
jgi:hypothetical protein